MPFRTKPATRSKPDQPIEVGIVGWGRELNDALAASGETAKPVFALFQEVPGCAGCQQFGADVLSNPIIVDAIESEFVPLLIHNNSPGRDAEVLAAFGEPAWNFQVVRFLDATGADIIERRDRVWETGPLAARMVNALETAGRDVPDYLRLVEQQHSGRLHTAYLAQPCFWVGETELGRIDGVVITEAGFMHGHEVTRIEFDPTMTSLASIVQQAQPRGVASAVFADAASLADLHASGLEIATKSAGKYRVAPASDQKRQIGRRITTTGLSPAQITKLNAFAPVSRSQVARFLSPRQLAVLQ